MTQQQFAAIWNHAQCALLTTSAEAKDYRLAEIKRLVDAELDRPLIKTGRTPGNEKPAGTPR